MQLDEDILTGTDFDAFKRKDYRSANSELRGMRVLAADLPEISFWPSRIDGGQIQCGRDFALCRQIYFQVRHATAGGRQGCAGGAIHRLQAGDAPGMLPPIARPTSACASLHEIPPTSSNSATRRLYRKPQRSAAASRRLHAPVKARRFCRVFESSKFQDFSQHESRSLFGGKNYRALMPAQTLIKNGLSFD
jgi:hypothetical protein